MMEVNPVAVSSKYSGSFIIILIPFLCAATHRLQAISDLRNFKKVKMK
jgi:hypothetical protein